jgi:hypothetical protein
MKFFPGDPVWARSTGRDLNNQPPAAEYAATVLEEERPEWYRIEILSYVNPLTHDHIFWSKGKFLRPRRDDYQQHEPLSTRDDLDRVIKQAATHGDYVHELEELLHSPKPVPADLSSSAQVILNYMVQSHGQCI